MKNIPSRVRWCIVWSCALLFASIDGQALTVSLQVIQADICGQGAGMLEASASGGTEPYQYDWYRIVNEIPEVYCLDCGANIQDLPGDNTYKVVVTDALALMAEQTASISVDMLWGMTDYLNVFAYVAGELPYMKVYVGGAWGQLGPGSSAVVEVTGADLYEEPVFPGSGLGNWWFRPNAPSGMVTVTYTFTGGQCVAQEAFTVPPPVVIPDMVVLDVQGSCSNAATGSVTIALSNGVTGQSTLLPWLGGAYSPPGQYVPVLLNGTTVTLENLYPGVDSFFVSGNLNSASPGNLGFPYGCVGSVQFTIPNLGPTCGRVQGKVFMDNNLDCAIQGVEPGVPDVVLEVVPGPYYSNTGSSGQYQLHLPNGSYSAALISSVVEEQCTGSAIPFTIAGNTATVNMPSISLVPLDANIALAGGAARPGFEYHVGLATRNLTPAPSGAITVTMDFDPALGFISATPAPTTVLGNTLTWDQPEFTPFQQRSIQVRLQIPPDVGLIGTDLITTASVATLNADTDPSNNTTTLVRTVTGSFDPNDKLARTSSGQSAALYFIDQDEWIDYTIRFQNTGTDTAFHIIVTDTLPGTLDPSTLVIGAASHPFTWQLREQGTLKFRFFDILLPDSNVNEAASHGFVSFRIRPRMPVLPGMVIENTANIYFDFNPPVITEPSVLVAEFSTGVAQQRSSAISLAPVPASDELIVTSGDAMSNVLILAADGREVMRMSARSPHLRIDLNGLKSGAYLLIAELQHGTTARERFIKQ
ncbi:MAG: hypothetical protein IPM12_09520 [Flavobacteriales bacterium]|nr:hypothetical protein [Flavobacteriales bacterium]